MSNESERIREFEERKATSPIHAMMDVEGYLKKSGIPERLHKPFHEMIIFRGEMPLILDVMQDNQLEQRFTQMSKEYGLQPLETAGLKFSVLFLTGQWLTHKIGSN